MIRRSLKDIHWLEFELFQNFPCLKHAIFLRHGGYSQGLYASLNLSFNVGDNPEHVRLNINKIKNVLNLSELFWNIQIHGKKIQFIENNSFYEPLECDGLTLNTFHKGLMTHHADCQTAIFYDPVHHALANVHCGWRGSVQNIYAETIKKMSSLYGTQPENIYVGISPSLGPLNAQFIHFKTELPSSFWDFQIKPLFFDFWSISIHQLLNCGLLRDHIQVAEINTFAHPEDYFSHRYSPIRGANATVAYLLEPTSIH